MQLDLVPDQLLTLPDPPAALWTDGNTKLLTHRVVAIIGSRDASPAAMTIAHRFAADFAGMGIVVVSGGALGIDAVAHTGAKGMTIVVLPLPFNRHTGQGYNQRQYQLYCQIVDDGGLLIAEQPNVPKLAYGGKLIRRNRLVTGLASAVLVGAMHVPSGTMAAVNHAVKQGRPLFYTDGVTGSDAVLYLNTRRARWVEDAGEVKGWVTA